MIEEDIVDKEYRDLEKKNHRCADALWTIAQVQKRRPMLLQAIQVVVYEIIEMMEEYQKRMRYIEQEKWGLK